MNVSIINIGDELLIGQVVNTNAAAMSKMLLAAGMNVIETMVVGDERDAIMSAIRRQMGHSDAVLVTGGLGPTKDDVTKKVLCEFFGSRMVENEMALQNVKRLFESRGYELTPVNRQQAWVPECCEVLNNDLGTAPCMWFGNGEWGTENGERGTERGERGTENGERGTENGERRGENVLVSLPGVPFEMEWLMRNRVIPKLKEHFKVGAIITKNILVQGIGESFLSDLIEPWELALPENIKLAYLPSAGLTKLRLTAVAGTMQDEPALHEQVASLLPGLYSIAGKYIVGEDCETLAELVHKRLIDMDKTLATAESCTGGSIASHLTAHAGASHYFKGGVVAYSNEVKEAQLGVRHETLVAHGAVSEETVREMVEGVRKRMDTDYAIATTGVAGPDGGTPEKPVGTVWIAVASREKTVAKLLQFGGNRRQQNIDRSVNQAYAMLMRMMRNEE